MRGSGKRFLQNRIKSGCWTVCILFALLETWLGRRWLNPDGISYLDMSDALARHNWHLLVNPQWSPLYPFLIGLATWLVKPAWRSELPVLHIVNFVVFLGAMTSFEFFLRQVIRLRQEEDDRLDPNRISSLPIWVLELIGYSLFAWGTFVLIAAGLRRISPDLCVAAFTYLDAGLVLRLKTAARKPQTFLLLGVSLGLGYFAKAALFPMAFVFLAVAFFVAGGWPKAIVSIATTLIVFAGVAAPLFIGISKAVGRPSFSESGYLNYAWHVNGEKVMPFYSSSPPPYLKHPIKRVFENPSVFDFHEPFRTTYPPWSEGWYWNSGVPVRFDLRQQLSAIAKSLLPTYHDLVAPVWGLIGSFVVLFFMGSNPSQGFQNLLRSWPLLVPGITALCTFAPVWMESRYVAPFVVLLLWLGLFMGVRLPKSQEFGNLYTVAILVASASLMTLCIKNVFLPPMGGPHFVGGVHYEIIEHLRDAGLPPGDGVAVIGNNFDGSVCARLARLRVVAQIPTEDADSFWRADPSVKAEVFATFARVGARAVITDQAPTLELSRDWQRLDNGPFALHFLHASGE